MISVDEKSLELYLSNFENIINLSGKKNSYCVCLLCTLVHLKVHIELAISRAA